MVLKCFTILVMSCFENRDIQDSTLSIYFHSFSASEMDNSENEDEVFCSGMLRQRELLWR